MTVFGFHVCQDEILVFFASVAMLRPAVEWARVVWRRHVGR